MCNQSFLCGVYIHWSNCDLTYICHLKSLFHIKTKVSKYILLFSALGEANEAQHRNCGELTPRN